LADSSNTRPVTRDTWQPPLFCPSPVAVHDDRDVFRKAVQVNLGQELRFRRFDLHRKPDI
jgi:hypothetical protein